MWPYKNITRNEFEKRKDFVEYIICTLGGEKINIKLPYEQKTTSLNDKLNESNYFQRPFYKFKDEYFRVDEVLFYNKPFIVLEYAKSISEVINNTMTDLKPFPYDLMDNNIVKEIKYSMGIEPYPNI